jgi:hypothetical protein
MMHDRDEDSEYHFSDDQVSYDAEPDDIKLSTAPSAKAPAAAAASRNSLRKPVIGVLIGVFLIFLIYKIIAPSSVTPTTEFSQNAKPVAPTTVIPVNTSKPAPAVAANQPAPPAAPATPPPTVAQAAPTPAPAAPTLGSADHNQPLVVPAPLAPSTSQPALSLEVAKPTLATSAPSSPPSVIPQPPEASQNPTAASIMAAAGAGDNNTMQTASMEKLIALQEQNAKLISQLQAEYAQKISSTDTQENDMQGKLQDLSMRIASIEASLTRLGKAIQELKKNRVEVSSNMPPQMPSQMPPPMMARPLEARMIYTVQAIIPGRAWLKSDAGDTITVAEGDTVKNYGRITKIDPYDGIVEIDTGGKVVTLSYGSNNG